MHTIFNDVDFQLDIWVERKYDNYIQWTYYVQRRPTYVCEAQ